MTEKNLHPETAAFKTRVGLQQARAAIKMLADTFQTVSEKVPEHTGFLYCEDLTKLREELRQTREALKLLMLTYRTVSGTRAVQELGLESHDTLEIIKLKLQLSEALETARQASDEAQEYRELYLNCVNHSTQE